MLAKLSDGYYLYISFDKGVLYATNCATSWVYRGNLPEPIIQWIIAGRPYRDYDICEEDDGEVLVLKVSSSTVSLKSGDNTKILPLMLTEMAMREPKRLLNERQEARLREKERKRREIFASCTYRNVALKIAYLGWDYDGLARQQTTRNTIEELILQACEKCCLIFTANNYSLTRCGRTDKGVSAFSQVVSLKLRSRSSELNEEYDYTTMINNLLPSMIRVLAWADVGLEFDSRFQVLFRSYTYYFPKCDLDVHRMESSLHYFIGTHNFRGFCKADTSNPNPNFERTVKYLSIDLVNENVDNPCFSIYRFTIIGNAFLWHQIRNLVSVLFRIGLGLESEKIIPDILKNKVKYSFCMASEIPLVLYDCEFENIEWKVCSDINLSQLWFEHAIKSTLIKSLIDKINGRQLGTIKAKDLGGLCDTKSQCITSRPFIK